MKNTFAATTFLLKLYSKNVTIHVFRDVHKRDHETVALGVKCRAA